MFLQEVEAAHVGGSLKVVIAGILIDGIVVAWNFFLKFKVCG